MRPFSSSQAYGHAARVSRPRLITTLGEFETRKYIMDFLGTLRLSPQESVFHFYPEFSFFYLKLSIVAVTFAIFFHHLMLPLFPQLVPVLGLLIPISAFVLLKRYRQFSQDKFVDHSRKHPFWLKWKPSIGFRMRSANVEATISKPKNPKAIVYLLAHYDSKSQNISISTRVICAIVLYLGIFILPVLTFFTLPFPGLWTFKWFQFVNYFLFIGTIVAGFSLAMMTVENKSPGALDNAGSCGLMMELAQSWDTLHHGPAFENIEIRMVWTGAEEVGLAGAEYLVDHNKENWVGKNLFFINLDGVGCSEKHSITSETGLFSKDRKSSAKLLDHVVGAARAQQIPLLTLKGIIGGEADHIPLIRGGYQAVSIGSYGKGTTSIHTADDTLENLNQDALDCSAKLVQRTLESLDLSFRDDQAG